MTTGVNSSGYNGFVTMLGTPLGQGIEYAGMIIDRNFENDMLYYITNTSVLDPLTKCGQMITFTKPPQVGPWRNYETDQHMIPDQPTTDSFCISICNQVYKSIKIDREDIRRACNNWADFEAGFLNDAWKQLSDKWHIDTLTNMQLQVSKRNIGKNAGRFKNVDLGTIGSPLALDPTNILDFISRMQRVLQEAGRWYDDEMFLLVPRSFNTLMLQTMYNKQYCCDPNTSVMFKGLKASDILGFSVIETDRLHPVVDKATKKLVYPILAGWNEAFAFTGDIVEAEIQPIPQSFGITYNMLSVYGSGAIYPEAMAKAYVTFSTDGTVA